MATIPDLTDADTWADDDLDLLRVAALTEQERRTRVTAAPAQLADLTRSAIASGCDPGPRGRRHRRRHRLTQHPYH